MRHDETRHTRPGDWRARLKFLGWPPRPPRRRGEPDPQPAITPRPHPLSGGAAVPLDEDR